MPKINISEVDKSYFRRSPLTSGLTYIPAYCDNTSKAGVHIFTNYDEFKEEFGSQDTGEYTPTSFSGQRSDSEDPGSITTITSVNLAVPSSGFDISTILKNKGTISVAYTNADSGESGTSNYDLSSLTSINITGPHLVDGLPEGEKYYITVSGLTDVPVVTDDIVIDNVNAILYIKNGVITPYEYAAQLLILGMGIIYDVCATSISSYITAVSNSSFEESPFSHIIDKFLYDVRFIVCPGYDFSNGTTRNAIYKNMVAACNATGDTLCILDHDINDTIIESIKGEFAPSNISPATGSDLSYATSYSPWFKNTLYSGEDKYCPPSFQFMTSFARMLRTSPIWKAPAGVNRMQVLNIVEPTVVFGGLDQRKLLEPVDPNYQSVNPICQIRNFGYTIFGQKTLKSQDHATNGDKSALKDLTTRIICNEIKRTIFDASIRIVFEENILRTWNMFKGYVEPLLSTMQEDGALTAHEIVMDESTVSEKDTQSNKVNGYVRISVAGVIEEVNIDFEIMPTGVNFLSEEYAE